MSTTAASRPGASGPLLRYAALLGVVVLAFPFILGLTGAWDWPELEGRMMGFAIAACVLVAVAGLIERRWLAVGMAGAAALVCADGYAWPHLFGMI